MHDPIRCFTAWRTMRLGTREVTEGILRPEYRGGGTLERALNNWPGAWYWTDPDRSRITLVRPLTERTPRRWLHILLFLLTLVCSLGAGAMLAGTWSPARGAGSLAGAVAGAGSYFYDVATRDWPHLLTGWSFALPLLAILLVHELGHYRAARRYAMDVSLPWFLPVPPTLSPIGSLGAFIRLRSALLDRRQLLDVGAAGPLAGFVVALGVLAWGYTTSERIAIVATGDPSYVTLAGHVVFLGESLLTRMLRDLLLPGTTAVHLSLPAFAGWVGMFITGLNLLPLSQLDGGHVVYGLIGRRQAVIGLLAIAGLLYLAQETPVWYLWVVIALVAGGGRWGHPAVLIPRRPVPPSRRWIGWLCVAVFAGTFVPYPFR